MCAGGGRFVCLDVEVPPALRGVELSAAQLEGLGARLVEYHVVRDHGGGRGGGVSADNPAKRQEDEK